MPRLSIHKPRSEAHQEPDSCRLAWARQPFRGWGASSPFRNATRCDVVVLKVGSFLLEFFLDFRSTLVFILTAILGPSAPRLGTPSSVQVVLGRPAMYLYPTHALFTLPLAVKFDGPLRCIVAVVSSTMKSSPTSPADSRPARLIVR